MTPKEKAEELISKFMAWSFYDTDRDAKGNQSEENRKSAIQCAIIAVDEILDYCPMAPVIPGMYYENTGDRISDAIDYWVKVKFNLEQ